MPQTYDSDDCRLELEAELATAQDDLAAEIKAHKRTAKSLAWYRDRVDMQLTHGGGMCPSCGAGLVPIPSKLPGGEDRLVCATCLQERLESRNASPIHARLRALRHELDALYRLADAKTETTTDDWAKIALAIDEAEQELEVIEKAVETAEREAEAQ